MGVQKLDEAVAFVGAGDDGKSVVKDLKAVVPLLADEIAFAGWGGYEAVDGTPSVAVPVLMGRIEPSAKVIPVKLTMGVLKGVKSPRSRALMRREWFERSAVTEPMTMVLAGRTSVSFA